MVLLKPWLNFVILMCQTYQLMSCVLVSLFEHLDVVFIKLIMHPAVCVYMYMYMYMYIYSGSNS